MIQSKQRESAQLLKLSKPKNGERNMHDSYDQVPLIHSSLITYRRPSTSPNNHHELQSRKYKNTIINKRVLNVNKNRYGEDYNMPGAEKKPSLDAKYILKSHNLNRG